VRVRVRVRVRASVRVRVRVRVRASVRASVRVRVRVRASVRVRVRVRVRASVRASVRVRVRVRASVLCSFRQTTICGHHQTSILEKPRMYAGLQVTHLSKEEQRGCDTPRDARGLVRLLGTSASPSSWVLVRAAD
jgi:hypothetical protein